MKHSEVREHLSIMERVAAMSRVGAALMSELDEARLLHLIAETACDLTGAAFAAFTLRPINEEGQPLVPSEGNLFHLAAIVGVTPAQEALFRRMPLGGEGLLAPIFRHGVPILVADAFAFLERVGEPQTIDPQDTARQAALAYAQGQLPTEALRSLGVPRGHPVVRSFLGVPLLDRAGQVRGGLLLGHSEPGQFTQDDEAVLVGLAAQAAVALENARLYRIAQRRTQEVDRIFESIGDGVMLVDHQGTILRENDAARRLRTFLQGTLEKERAIKALLYSPAQRVLNEEAVQDIIVSVGDENGEAHEYLVTASPLHPPLTASGSLKLGNEAASPSQSSISGVVVVWHDVTERRIREAERAARTHASHLEAIFEAMTDGVFVYDRNGHIVQMNAVGRQLVARRLPPGYAALPLMERSSALVVSDEHGQPFSRERGPITRILAGEELTPENAVEVVLGLHDGGVLRLSLTGGPLRDADERIIGAVVISRDVTERRRLEQIERQMHAETEARLTLLQLILDELPSGVYLVRGHDARLVLTNRTAAQVWGAPWLHDQPMSEFLTQQGIRIFGIDGRPLAPEQLATLRAVQQGETVWQHQEIIRHPDGTALPVLMNAVALDAQRLSISPLQAEATPASETEHIAIVVHQDVTALKEAEKLKDEFIGIAAHELRNPLAVLKGYAQMLLVQAKQNRGSALTDWQMEALQGIDQSTTRLVELTEDLLDVTHLQSGGLRLHMEPTDLVALTRRVVKRHQMTTEQHSLSLATPLPYLVVHADSERMEQVLSNLLGNAIKYSPDGGTIEITLREEVEANEARLSICDRGIGIPQQDQTRLFGRFARASNTRAYGISGSGLGLYLCRELVERHGGRIWFESAEGHGSRFFITLPIIADTVLTL